MSVLSHVSQCPPSAIRTFVTALGRPLLVKGESPRRIETEGLIPRVITAQNGPDEAAQMNIAHRALCKPKSDPNCPAIDSTRRAAARLP
jgi:hypothetical protein